MQLWRVTIETLSLTTLLIRFLNVDSDSAATTTKRAKPSPAIQQHRLQDLPIKDPSKHVSARVRGYRRPACRSCKRKGAICSHNEGWLEEGQKEEAKTDAWLQELMPRLQAGEKFPIRDPRDTTWQLHCSEFFTQYLGEDICWLNGTLSMRVDFTDSRYRGWGFHPIYRGHMSAEWLLNRDVAPDVGNWLAFKVPTHGELGADQDQFGSREG